MFEAPEKGTPATCIAGRSADWLPLLLPRGKASKVGSRGGLAEAAERGVRRPKNRNSTHKIRDEASSRRSFESKHHKLRDLCMTGIKVRSSRRAWRHYRRANAAWGSTVLDARSTAIGWVTMGAQDQTIHTRGGSSTLSSSLSCGRHSRESSTASVEPGGSRGPSTN